MRRGLIVSRRDFLVVLLLEVVCGLMRLVVLLAEGVGRCPC